METEILTITPDLFFHWGFFSFLNSKISQLYFFGSYRFWIETEFHTIPPKVILPLGFLIFLKFLNFNSCIL